MLLGYEVATHFDSHIAINNALKCNEDLPISMLPDLVNNYKSDKLIDYLRGCARSFPIPRAKKFSEIALKYIKKNNQSNFLRQKKTIIAQFVISVEEKAILLLSVLFLLHLHKKVLGSMY